MMIKRRDITIAYCTINWSCGRKWRRENRKKTLFRRSLSIYIVE